MNVKKPVLLIIAGVLCLLAAVIWMIAVKASSYWYTVPSFIGGWLIVEGIISLKQKK